jgi:hypothetical protein
MGDILYFAGGVWVLGTLIKWVWYLLRFREYGERLGISVISMINTLVFIYLFFLLGWGFNYEKEPLRKYWSLGSAAQSHPTPDDTASINLRRAKDSLALVAFDGFLVNKLNSYAPHFHSTSFKNVNDSAKAYYLRYTDSKVKKDGLGVKPMLFGFVMQRMAVDGYYNPFTGEGQVDGTLPGFELPFIICHEMAHQAGIGDEGDANLMAYAVGTMANDSSFNYSCYLNIWLYTNSRLYRRDSTVAKSFEHRLNALTAAHIDTLDQISNRYNSTMTLYSGKIYDSYLKLQDQKDGIRSYGNVSISAWQLEQKRTEEPQAVIRIP